jgi:hypothetical protein
MLSMLEKRGFVHQVVGSRNDLERLMTEKRIGIYCGVDPTAPSLHVGHLLPLMVLYWSYIKGFHTCSLVGVLLYDRTYYGDLTMSSLEVPLHRLEIQLGEPQLGISSIPRYEKSI